MGKISNDEVLKLAKLSKIALTDQEVEKYAKEFGVLLDYIEQLQAIDTNGLEPTDQVTGLVNVMRSDKESHTQSQDDLLKNLPDRQENLIKVRRVLL